MLDVRGARNAVDEGRFKREIAPFTTPDGVVDADQGLRDGATGLYTRPHFDEQLRREVDLSTREHREFALVLIEIDPPGERVLELGPAAQGRILEALGRLLRGNTRAMDASCRLDERLFGVLLSGVGLATAQGNAKTLTFTTAVNATRASRTISSKDRRSCARRKRYLSSNVDCGMQ